MSRCLKYFDAEFAEAVKTGKKLHTVRKKLKNIPTVGDILDARTREGERLIEAPITLVSSISISEGICIGDLFCFDAHELAIFAQQDGFKTWDAMRAYINKRYGLPFEGVLIQWEKGAEG